VLHAAGKFGACSGFDKISRDRHQSFSGVEAERWRTGALKNFAPFAMPQARFRPDQFFAGRNNRGNLPLPRGFDFNLNGSDAIGH
jgi:hypothetical protein